MQLRTPPMRIAGPELHVANILQGAQQTTLGLHYKSQRQHEDRHIRICSHVCTRSLMHLAHLTSNVCDIELFTNRRAPKAPYAPGTLTLRNRSVSILLSSPQQLPQDQKQANVSTKTIQQPNPDPNHATPNCIRQLHCRLWLCHFP